MFLHSEISSTNKKNKRVSFNLHKHVYVYTNINNDKLWWSDYELSIASNSAQNEIFGLMNIHPYMTIQDAKKLLYQPNNISSNNYKISRFLG